MSLEKWKAGVLSRLLAATPGPWRLERNTYGMAHEGYTSYRVIEVKETPDIKGAKDGEDNHKYIATANGFGQQQTDNANLIAHAPTDINGALKMIKILSTALHLADCDCAGEGVSICYKCEALYAVDEIARESL